MKTARAAISFILKIRMQKPMVARARVKDPAQGLGLVVLLDGNATSVG